MRVDVVTLFPDLFTPFLDVSFVGKARQQGQLQVRFQSPRDFGLGVHRSVDDTPYGGGSGMLLRVDCVVAAMEALDQQAPDEPKAHRVLMTPQGRPFDQSAAQRFAATPAVMLVCGRYEGFDERVRHFVDEEVSLGDFVLSGGEISAMAVIEATVRLLPGVLGNGDSIREESHSPHNSGLLEYPQYTRPAEFRRLGVEPILLSGDHGRIARWRSEQARDRTLRKRPDLLARQDRSATQQGGGKVPGS
jgi:tRNA (guanine37-N1)-methyltransferase